MYYAKSKLPKRWKGWGFEHGYLVDENGNRYSPEMVKASLFAQQLAHELTGSPLQILSLRDELRKRVDALQETPEVVIRWHGQEVIVKLPKAT